MNVSPLSSPWPLRGFNSRTWQSFSSDFSLADHTLPTRPEPAWQKMAQSPPQWHHTTCRHRGGRPKSNHGQTMAEAKQKPSLGRTQKVVNVVNGITTWQVNDSVRQFLHYTEHFSGISKTEELLKWCTIKLLIHFTVREVQLMLTLTHLRTFRVHTLDKQLWWFTVWRWKGGSFTEYW